MNLRKIMIALLFAAAGTGFLAGQQSGSPASQTPAHFYNVDSERRVEGSIRDILFEPRYEERSPFLIIVLEEKATGQIYRVEVSPAWFFGHDLHKGEPVKIIGSFYARDGEFFLIARELQAGPETFRLRDSRGFPNWRGGQMKGKMKRQGRGM